MYLMTSDITHLVKIEMTSEIHQVEVTTKIPLVERMCGELIKYLHSFENLTIRYFTAVKVWTNWSQR